MSTRIAEKPVSQKPTEGRAYLKGVKVVDADTHITEWPDLWTSRATPKYKNRVPQIKVVDGKPIWIIDDHKLMGDNGSAAIKKDGTKVPGLEFFDLHYDDVHPGSYDLRARLAYMDQEGFAAQIGYSNQLGFGGRNTHKIDADLRLVSTQILNDAMAELQVQSNNRIYPMAMLPWWDIKLAVAEAERCANMGLRGVNTHSMPHEHGLPDLGDLYWTPLWDLCEDRKLPVNFHIGFSDGAEGFLGTGLWKSHPDYIKFCTSGAMLFTSNMSVLVNLLESSVFQRHPKLRFVSVESGLGWIPYMLESVEYQLSENKASKEFQRSTVLDDFRNHIYVCGWFEKRGMLNAIRATGADNVLFETDFPHPTCLYPKPLDFVAPVLTELTADERRKVFGQNAERLYNLDLSGAPAIT
jgi:predicted TIM-barrel fold metal-dependent hydrolase